MVNFPYIIFDSFISKSSINLNKKRDQNFIFFCELYTHWIKFHSELKLQLCRFF